MHLGLRIASSVTLAALAASLVATPDLLSPASAAPAPAAVAAAATETAQCAAARATWTDAKAAKARAHRAVAAARHELRKARHTGKPARIHKAKKKLKRSKHRYAVRSHSARTAYRAMSYACAAPTSTTRADATGQVLDLLVLATGTLGDAIDPTQLTTLVEQLLPGVSDVLSTEQLTALLDGFNRQNLSLEDATALLGGSFSTDQLQDILGGAASPALVTDLAEFLVAQLSEMGGGLPIAGPFDPSDLLDTIAGMFGDLDPSQLGALLDLALAAVADGSDSPLDLGQLTDLLDSLLPGASDLFTPDQLSSMLAAVNAGHLDPSTLSNLLGGQLSADQIGQLLAGTASAELIGELLTNVLAQLGTADGGPLTLPGSVDPSVLLDLASTIEALVSDLLGGLLGGGGDNPVCTILPILC